MSYSTCQIDCHEHRQDVLELWSRNLPESPAARYTWLYETGRATGWLLRSEGENVVGANGVLGRRMLALGRSVYAGQAIDLNVDRDHRTVGPALGLQRELTAAASDGRFGLVYGLPNVQSLAVLRRIGFRKLGDVERWYMPIRCESILRGRLRHPLVRTLACVVADSALCFRRRAVPGSRLGRNRVYVTDHFDSRFDKLWQRGAPQFSVIGQRTAAYLTWRFGQSPQSRYRAFCLSSPEGRLSAYLVYCCREGAVSINDFFFTDAIDLRALLVAFLRRMREEKAGAVTTVYLGPGRVARIFQQLGFFRRPSPWTAVAYVDRQQWGPLADRIFDKDNWYLTRADIDTDL